MTAVEVTKLRSAAASVAKGTARAPVATTAWGSVFWWLLVDRWHVLVSAKGSADLGTFVVIGLIVTVWTAALRAGERRYPWLAVLLLSQGAPTWQPAEEPAAPEPAAVVGGDVNIGQVNVAAPAPPVDPAVFADPAAPVPVFAPDPNAAAAPAPAPVFAPTPFEALPPAVLAEVAEYAYGDHPAITFSDDAADVDAPHGVNTPDEMN